ncbi:MAG TPA: hypothetical protein VGV93_05625 [Acidimicrobiales bacterium]|nr:hypothetical protein [Acidimicrobiales bacterium]
MSPPIPFWQHQRGLQHPLQGPERRSSGQQGSVLPLVALLIVAAGGLCVALGRLGGDAVEAAQARTAADAAALAGAAEGEAAARAVAEDNGAVLVVYFHDGLDVEVRARVGHAEVGARATRTAGGPAAPAAPGEP